MPWIACAPPPAPRDPRPEEVAKDEDYWAEIRDTFRVDRTMLNLNNGHVCPRRAPCGRRCGAFWTTATWAVPHHVNVLERGSRKRAAALAQAAGCDPEEMAITRNASESLENCAVRHRPAKGDEVLTTNQDYPRMLTTFRQRRAARGHRAEDDFVSRAAADGRPVPALREAVTPRTKLILVCHITNRTGQIFPVKRICQMAHARNIPVIVDGAHAFSHFPLKIADLDCDYYGVSLHKWTYAPVGTGFLYVKKRGSRAPGR